jgi:hypothetical protein
MPLAMSSFVLISDPLLLLVAAEPEDPSLITAI